MRRNKDDSLGSQEFEVSSWTDQVYIAISMSETQGYLPFLDVGPNINLVGKGSTWLSVQVPVGVGNLLYQSSVSEAPEQRHAGRTKQTYPFGGDLGVGMVKLVVFGSFDIDDAVDDGMSHVDALGSKFPGQRLIQSSQSKLAGSKRCTVCGTLQSCSC